MSASDERQQHVGVAHVTAPMEVQPRRSHTGRHQRTEPHAHRRREQSVHDGELDQHAHAHQQHERAEQQRAVPADDRLDLLFAESPRRRRSRARMDRDADAARRRTRFGANGGAQAFHLRRERRHLPLERREAVVVGAHRTKLPPTPTTASQALRLHHHLGAAVLLVAEHLVRVRRILEREPMADERRGVDLAVEHALQQVGHELLHVALPCRHLQPFREKGAERELVDHARRTRR